MKNIWRVLCAATFAVALGGCAVQPVAYRPQPMVIQPVPEEQFDYTGMSQPLYFDAYPGVPFYRRWDMLGCNCITSIGFVTGIGLINYWGVSIIVPNGGWRRPPVHIIAAHREQLRTNPHMFSRTQGRVAVVRPAAPHAAAPAAQTHTQQRPSAQRQKPATQQRGFVPPPRAAAKTAPKVVLKKCPNGKMQVKC